MRKNDCFNNAIKPTIICGCVTMSKQSANERGTKNCSPSYKDMRKQILTEK